MEAITIETKSKKGKKSGVFAPYQSTSCRYFNERSEEESRFLIASDGNPSSGHWERDDGNLLRQSFTFYKPIKVQWLLTLYFLYFPQIGISRRKICAVP